MSIRPRRQLLALVASVIACSPAPTTEPAELTLSPTTRDFGSVALGSSSADVVFTVTNSGKGASTALSTALSGANAAQFTLVENGCTSALAAAATCTVTVHFTPSGATAATATLEVASTVAAIRATASLSGQGLAPAALGILPMQHTFANTQVGGSTPQTFIITNTGSSPAGPLMTARSGADAADFTVAAGTDGCQGSTLAGGATCTLVVAFTPSTTGAKSAALTLSAAGTTASALLGGTAVTAAMLTLSPASGAFGSVGLGATSGTTLFTVTNDGMSSSGPVTATLSGTDAADFTLTPVTACGTALAPSASCSFNVAFSPTSLGLKSASLAVSATPGGTMSATLGGTGVGAAAVTMTTPLHFGDVTVGQTTDLTVTVTNNGASPAGRILGLPLSGADAAEFSVIPGGVGGCVPNTTVLGAGGTCTVVLRFAPTTGVGLTNAKVATLTATLENAVGGAPTSALDGNARALVTLSSTNVSPVLPGEFGNARIGVTAGPILVFTVTNNATSGGPSSGPLAINSLGAPNANQFALCTGANCNAAAVGTCALAGTTSLAPGATCTVKAQFSPTAAGLQTSSLSVAGTAPTSNASVALTGTGTPALSISPLDLTPPSSFDFGAHSLNTTTVQTFTVANGAGVAPTTSTLRYALSNNAGGAFGIVGGTCTGGTTLSPAPASCTIDVAFFARSPAAVKTATLDVTGSPSNVLAVALTGRSITSSLVTIAAGGAFGTPLIGGAAVPLTYTLTNSGQTTIPPGALAYSLSGPKAAEYTISHPAVGGACGAVSSALAPSSSCTLVVTYTAAVPPAPPAHTATLTVTGPANSANIALTASPVSPLTVSPPTYDFGSVRTTTSSMTQVFTVTNGVGAGTITGMTITTGGSSVWQTSGSTCTGTLAEGSSCSVTATFVPSASGLQTQNLTFAAFTAGGQSVVGLAAMSGTGASPALLAFTPTGMNFGTLIAGQTSDVITFSVRNSASAGSLATGPLSTSIAMLPLEYAIVGGTCSGTSLTVGGAACTVQVQFNPPAGTGASTRFGTLSITGPNLAAAATASLAGTVVAPTTLVLDHSAHDYGAVAVPATDDFTFTLRNNSATLAAVGLTVTANGAYTIPTNNCGTTLGANLICTLVVRYTPSGSGQQAGTLTITSANNPTVTAGLIGRALSPAQLVVNTAGSLNPFPPTAVGSVSPTASVTVQNLGDQTSAMITAALSGSDPTHFSVNNPCTTLTTNQVCMLSVSFAPTTSGAKAALLTIGPNVPGVIQLTGSAVSAPVLGLSPSGPQAFTNTVVGTQNATVVTYTLSINAQTGRTGILSGSVTGAPNFTILPPLGNDCVLTGGDFLGPTSTNPDTCTIRVAFTPTSVGSFSGVLTVTAAAATGGGGTVASGALAGIGTSALTVSPPSFSYPGTLAGGFSAVQMFTFTAAAGAPTTSPLATALSGATSDFIITSDNCFGLALSAGSSCNVGVRFTPVAPAGARAATLTVSSPGTQSSAAATLTGTSL